MEHVDDRPSLTYRLFGWWYRWQACRMTAVALKGPWTDKHDTAHIAWSLTVFLESYMVCGSKRTQEDFGPKEPVELGLVKSGKT